jgi:hypothetical protein
MDLCQGPIHSLEADFQDMLAHGCSLVADRLGFPAVSQVRWQCCFGAQYRDCVIGTQMKKPIFLREMPYVGSIDLDS